TIIIVATLVLVLLAVAVVLAGLCLSRLGTLVETRDAMTREAAHLRARLEVLAAQNADFERDVRQDFASARAEQAAGAQTARTELGATLANHTQTMQVQLTGMAGAHNQTERDVREARV